MKGDVSDIIFRLSAVLPKRWFAEQSPNLTAILGSISTPWAWLYKLIGYVIYQTRLGTATDDWLDLIANDYFGAGLTRATNETDAVYRARIKMALLREAATRSAVSSGLECLVGRPPIIFEPANCRDTGAYGTVKDGVAASYSGFVYGQAGGWGNLTLPLQCFITTTRPPTLGFGMLSGYGIASGGYGVGSISYGDLSLFPGQVTDQDIQHTLCRLLPVNAVAWLRIV